MNILYFCAYICALTYMINVLIGSGAPLNIATSDIYPDTSYLLPDSVEYQLRDYESRTGYEIIKSLSYANIEQWKHPKPVERLMVFNTASAIGDHLWTTAVIREIKRLHPDTAIDVVAGTSAFPIYENNKDVRSLRSTPFPSYFLDYYDGHLIYDELVASRKDIMQPNAYQILFEQAGLSFTPEKGKPVLVLKKYDQQEAFGRLVRKAGEEIPFGIGHIVLGLHTSSECRNLPKNYWADIVGEFIEKTEGKRAIIGLSNNDIGAMIQDSIIERGYQQYIPCHKTLTVRHIAALCRTALFVLSLDTALVHIAAAFDVPTVAIMSTVPPTQRVSTYSACVPIWNADACYFAPCFHKRPSFAFHQGELTDIAPCAYPQRTRCDVMGAVTMKQIFEAVRKAINLDRRRLTSEKDCMDFMYSLGG
jgi:ADP-heptose:LPS heptosyltransferase